MTERVFAGAGRRGGQGGGDGGVSIAGEEKGAGRAIGVGEGGKLVFIIGGRG